MKTVIRCSALLLLLVFSAAASADTLYFRNGDRLTGTLQKLEEDKITFKSSDVGTVTTSVDNIETFATTSHIEVHRTDGKVVTGSVARGAIPLDEIFEINPYDASWIGNVSLGVQLERGNTVRTGGDVNLALRRRFEISRIQLTAGYSGIRGNNDDGDSVTEKRQLWGGIQFDRFVTPKWFWFAHSNAERDGLADLDLRLITGGGFGYQILDTKRFDMSVRSGLNWVHERYSPDTGSGDYPAGMLRWEVRGKLTDLLAFEHIGEWIPSLDDFGNNQLIRTQVSLRQMLYKQWFGEVRLAWQLNTEPAEDAKRQDTSYVLALGWGF